MKKRHFHFSNIARKYAVLRTTDIAPIQFINDRLSHLDGTGRIFAADIGCGAGRYDIQLYSHIGERLFLTCIDENEYMLHALIENFQLNKIENYRVVNAKAEILPLADASLNCVFSFNAIHHFELELFLNEVSRILKKNGYIFIYTRSRSQNKRNIWGRYFPKFYEKEKRLYEVNELREAIKKRSDLQLDSIEFFKYRRVSDFQRLLTQVANHHYSTFYLAYKGEEFEDALEEFKKNIFSHFENLERITWYDENLMLVIRKL
ncbi:MAG: hypothetical protein B5M53_09895 [Candidatus Cloacimonas sp. 4484_209]|nr:MAG: hypothetical protein B5M53_09895 [Candidatus Cloacimonas sp. 4484_209]